METWRRAYWTAGIFYLLFQVFYQKQLFEALRKCYHGLLISSDAYLYHGCKFLVTPYSVSEEKRHVIILVLFSNGSSYHRPC